MSQRRRSSSLEGNGAKHHRSAWQTWGMKVVSSTELALFLLSLAVKLLLIPAYHSTDFEVHRNWLAITHTLPLSNWYYEATSEWTLDYPPFFAWFEYFLSLFAGLFDKDMLLLHNLNHASLSTKLFQRLTVICTDLLFFYGLFRVCHTLYPSTTVSAGHSQSQKRETEERNKLNAKKRLIVMALTLFNPGLIIVDHIHFQYNGFLTGFLLLSINAILKGQVLWGAAYFAMLLNLKHIYMYMAPVYFVYLLRNYCFISPPPSASSHLPTAENVVRAGQPPQLPQLQQTVSLQRKQKGFSGFQFGRFSQLGGVVLSVFALSFGPFIYLKQIPQVLSRLFPFGRGLCNAYWAPNFWALYNLLDKTFAAVLQRLGVQLNVQAASMTSGLVGDEAVHAVLPTIRPLHTFIITVVSAVPMLWKILDNAHPPIFIPALVQSTLCFFMFSWHVHEKAILMATIPLGLLMGISKDYARFSFFLSTIGHYSLFPLLFLPQEYPIRMGLLLLHSMLSFILLSSLWSSSKTSEKSGQTTASPTQLCSRGEGLFLFLLLLVDVEASFVHPTLLPNVLPFFPLMLTSVFCGIGVHYAFLRLYQLMLSDPLK